VLYTKQNLLLDHLGLLSGLDRSLPVLDLACGSGRNGLVLAQQGVPVVFADHSVADLDHIKRHLAENDLPGRTWQVDLEQPGSEPLAGRHFSAIICFRYLHRPIFPALLEAVVAGGLVVYETFTTENRRFGRPNNPDFLLEPGELKTIFKDWQIVFCFEGELQNPDRNVAQLVARKPGLDNTSVVSTL
jgi:tellurite methyltransferase